MAQTLIFGGSFDPIHHGHLLTAQAAAEAVGAAQVLLIPAGASPFKHGAEQTLGGAGAEHRLAMIKLAIEGLASWAVDDLELRRAGPSFTIDTVEALQTRWPGRRFTWLLGADQLPQFHRWHRVGDLLAKVEVAILPRPGTDPGPALAVVGETLGAAVAERLRAAVLRTARIEISATQIRERVGRGLSIRYWVPAAVEGYIRAQGLYARSEES